jgi:hypothetical protein
MTPVSGHKTGDAPDEQNKTENERPHCLLNYFQEKHRCMIIYAITFITIVELIYLCLQNGGSTDKVMELMSKYLNRTNKYMK